MAFLSSTLNSSDAGILAPHLLQSGENLERRGSWQDGQIGGILFCRTFKMSRDLRWRDPCGSEHGS